MATSPLSPTSSPSQSPSPSSAPRSPKALKEAMDKYKSSIGKAQEQASLSVQNNPSKDPMAKLNSDLGTFVKMLTTELKFQDPTDPMDTKGMAQQLALFSSVEQQTKTNQKLDSLVKISRSNGFSAVSNYVGKRVELKSSYVALQEGKGAFYYVLPTISKKTKITILDDKKHAVFSTSGQTVTGKHKFIWDGKNQQGKNVPDGIYTVRIDAYDSQGTPITPLQTMEARVTGATFTNDEPTLLIGRLEASLSDLISMTEESLPGEDDLDKKEKDLDQDGHLDRGVEDIDQDGHLDAVNEDINGNGVLDSRIARVWGEDRNHNNILDPGEDINHNGSLDHTEDINNNGKLDAGEDINKNGAIDVGYYSEDLDGDGHLDTGEDVNHNGILDEGEDLDGDGYLDLTEDLDRDGRLDIVNEDINGDGLLDGRQISTEDLDKDSRLELGIEDLDGDGHFDGQNEDIDHDGHLDVYEADKNQNNRLDSDEDLDGDGRWDTNEDLDKDGRLDTGEDINHNGRLDPGEDIDKDGKLSLTEDLDGDKHFDNIKEDANNNGRTDTIHGPTRNDEYVRGSLLWRVRHNPASLTDEEISYLQLSKEQLKKLKEEQGSLPTPLVHPPQIPQRTPHLVPPKSPYNVPPLRSPPKKTLPSNVPQREGRGAAITQYSQAVDRWLQSKKVAGTEKNLWSHAKTGIGAKKSL